MSWVRRYGALIRNAWLVDLQYRASIVLWLLWGVTEPAIALGIWWAIAGSGTGGGYARASKYGVFTPCDVGMCSFAACGLTVARSGHPRSVATGTHLGVGVFVAAGVRYLASGGARAAAVVAMAASSASVAWTWATAAQTATLSCPSPWPRYSLAFTANATMFRLGDRTLALRLLGADPHATFEATSPYSVPTQYFTAAYRGPVQSYRRLRRRCYLL